MLLVQKRCGWIIARTCANGSTLLEYITKHEAASTTVSHVATVITVVKEAKH